LKAKRYVEAASCFRGALAQLEDSSPETLIMMVESSDGGVTTTIEILASTQLYILKALDSSGEPHANEATAESNRLLERISDADQSQCRPALVVLICQSIAKCQANCLELRIKACKRVLKDSTCGTPKQRRLFYELQSSLHESGGDLEAAAASTAAGLTEAPNNQMNRKRLRDLRVKLGLVDVEKEGKDADMEAARREKQRTHKKRTRQRRKHENLERLEELLSLLARDIDATLNTSTRNDFFASLREGRTDSTNSINWKSIPVEITPEASLQRKKDVRVKRKLCQLEALFTLLRQVIDALMAKSNYSKDRPLHIVDFGSGSGNSCLVFAHLLRDIPCRFTLVDIKPKCVSIGKDRTEKAGLEASVAWKCGNVESFYESFDIGLATHLCGGATDVALSKCIDAGASFIATPCCLGSIKFALGDDSHLKARVDGRAPVLHRNNDLTYPRSSWLRDKLTLEEYAAMTSLGDCTVAVAEEEENGLRMKGKRLLDADRLALAREAGYGTSLGRLGSKEKCGPKSDVLLGLCGLCEMVTS
jgi:SAM-dependent methyltransferase